MDLKSYLEVSSSSGYNKDIISIYKLWKGSNGVFKLGLIFYLNKNLNVNKREAQENRLLDKYRIA